jgi:hypothetical protein
MSEQKTEDFVIDGIRIFVKEIDQIEFWDGDMNFWHTATFIDLDTGEEAELTEEQYERAMDHEVTTMMIVGEVIDWKDNHS